MLLIIDAFACQDQAYRGNPAAVCILDKAAKTSWMQALAEEMNLSETCFPVPRADGDWDLRWFTPRIEVDCCGHATLAAAQALWETGKAAGATITFHTRSGPLTVRRDGAVRWLCLPATSTTAATADDRLWEALGCHGLQLRQAGPDLLVEIAEAEMLPGLRPDLGIFAELPYRGICVMALTGDTEPACVSRFFAPAAGIPEDPVTGSAHAAIAPLVAQRLGRQAFIADQVSARGGRLHVRVDGDQVELGGELRTVLRGELRIAISYADAVEPAE